MNMSMTMESVKFKDLQYVDWQQDDMVLWDNWRMLHSARGVPPGEARKMRRTTIAGDYALGRRFEPAGHAETLS